MMVIFSKTKAGVAIVLHLNIPRVEIVQFLSC